MQLTATWAAAVLGVLLTSEYGEAMSTLSHWLPVLVRLALATGDETTAAAAAEACRQDANRAPLPRKQASVDWCRGLLHTDPAPVLAAAAFYRAAGRRPDLGNALEDAAVLLAVTGHRESARTALSEALTLYTELGAVWDARHATARMRPHGIRPGVRGPRHRPKTGRYALTPTELRVADLVAQRRSNPEIATDPLLSRHTVESHVSHILAKLQVRSRREITELWDQYAREL